MESTGASEPVGLPEPAPASAPPASPPDQDRRADPSGPSTGAGPSELPEVTSSAGPVGAPGSLQATEVPSATHRYGHRARRSLWRWSVSAMAGVVVAGAVSVGIVRARAGPPLATIDPKPHPVRTLGEPVPDLPWPIGAEAAVAIPAIGLVQTSPRRSPAPIASLTKIMTAYVILRDHPIADDANGPDITVTYQDVADYDHFAGDDVTIPVVLGEVLTERQLLEGLLVRSANNFGDVLANWDAGSVSSFVNEMNRTANGLGLSSTHFVDTDGLDTRSMSTPEDLVMLTAKAMSIPAFSQIVAMTSVSLPIEGTLDSYTPLVGQFGVIGVKSGFTDAAGGCDVLALSERVHHHLLIALAAVIGVNGSNGIALAADFADSLAEKALGAVYPFRVPGRTVVAVASVPGAGTSTVVTERPATLLVWPGQRIDASVAASRPHAGAPAGTRVGRALFRNGPELVTVPIRTDQRLPSPSFFQRLF